MSESGLPGVRPTNDQGVSGNTLQVVTSSRADRLAGQAAVGLAVYLALSVLLFRLRTDYNFLRTEESDYAVGRWSPLMDLAYLVRGACSAAVVLALSRSARPEARSRTGEGLLWVWAVASALLAFFPSDLEGQHPQTASGGVHLILALAAFLAAPAGQLCVGWRLHADVRWRALCPVLIVLPVLAAGAFVLTFAAWLAPGSLDGLWERVFLGLVLAWLLVVALRIHGLYRIALRI